jgi:hypothetical protein
MQLLVNYPLVVAHYAPDFESVFSPTGYMYFQRYLSGILVSDNVTLSAINELFVLERRNQSSFNRFVHRGNFDLTALNSRRLSWLQASEALAFKASSGVLSLDDTLLSHYGRHFEHIQNLWIPSEERYALCHNLVNVHYSDDQTDYPVYNDLWVPPDFEQIADKMRELGLHINAQRWDNRESDVRGWRSYMRDRFRRYQHKCPELNEVYQTKIYRGLDLLKRFYTAYPDLDLPVAMDNGYTSGDACAYIDKTLQRAYVGSLAPHHIVLLKEQQEVCLGDFAKRLVKEHQEKAAQKPVFLKTSYTYKGEKKTVYAYCATHNFKGFDKQRLVIAYKNEDLSDAPTFSITNRYHWQASGILRIRRHRWPVETFHQEGKDEGLGDYQLRDFKAIKVHIAFVATAYSMLKRANQDESILTVFRQRLNTEPSGSLPLLRRLLNLEALLSLIELVHIKAQQGQSIQEVFNQITNSIGQ